MLGCMEDKRWILVEHGDWSEGVRAPNPSEPGVYMPLTKKDLPAYKPGKVLLGNVHLSLDLELVHYPGSPTPRTSPIQDHGGPLCMQPETTLHLAARMQSPRSR